MARRAYGEILAGFMPVDNGATCWITFLVRGFCPCAILPVGLWMSGDTEPFEEILIRSCVGVSFGNTFWCHSLPSGDVDISSDPCARRSMGKGQATDDADIKFLSRQVM